MTRRAAYGTYMFTRREIARYLNVWGQTVVPPVIMAALFLFVFGHALGSRIGDFGGVPYLTFLVPGLIVQGAIQNAYSNTSSSLFDARRAGYIEDILTSPLRDWQVVLSYTVSGASRGILIGVMTLAVAWPVGSGWDIAWPTFAVVTVLSCLLFALIGIIAGIYASRWDHIFVPVTFILTPLTFLGGVFYPVSELPGGLQTASRFNPILYIVDATRASMMDVHDLPVAPSLWLLGAACILLFAAVLRVVATTPRLRG